MKVHTLILSAAFLGLSFIPDNIIIQTSLFFTGFGLFVLGMINNLDVTK